MVIVQGGGAAFPSVVANLASGRGGLDGHLIGSAFAAQ